MFRVTSHKFGKLQQPPLFVDIPISSATNQSSEHFPFSPSVSVECIRQILYNEIKKMVRKSILYVKNIKYNKKSPSTVFGEK
jgi:nicotinamide mononucleotide adenylyltransferase